MHKLIRFALPTAIILSSGCALFEQETSTSEAPPPPAVDQSMRLDVDTALDLARQALQEAQEARELARQALIAAEEAQNSANACQQRCEAVEDQIERAFQQSQSK